MIDSILKYPRTHHVEGSKLQPGDEDLSQIPMADLVGRNLVIEEKLDGANTGISFTSKGEMRLQSRGHFLTGGPREKHFALLKTWAATHRVSLHEVLADRYVMYGEWLFAKHTIFYDRLPHWFMEFDVWDRHDQAFLSTPQRQILLKQAPITSVPVLFEGAGKNVDHLRSLIGPSTYKSENWRDALLEQAKTQGLNPEPIIAQTDSSDLAEGLYIKHERDGMVVGRYKFIRVTFLQAVARAQGHWLNRPILPNKLAANVDILAGKDDHD